ncbi:MAG: hypothetical protein KGZ83_06295 [Sulfuricella sp.]|nr:hypothetical protein [Sulfuricella sp.]
MTNAEVAVSIVNPAQVKDIGAGLAVRTKPMPWTASCWPATVHCSSLRHDPAARTAKEGCHPIRTRLATTGYGR